MTTDPAARRTLGARLGVLLAVLVSLPTLAQPGGAPAELEDRLEAFVERMDRERAAANIPALSVALVREGELVLARGLGTADIERGIGATPETRYCIGSTTKHMTAALVAQLESEGLLSLDDHPRDHLKGFALSDPEADADVTLRDLLAHRTGLTRMSLLWYGSDAPFDAILGAVARAELYRPFRTEFLYNNVMYASAGRVAGNAAGSDWSALMADRFFGPVGMDSATTSLDEFRGHPLAARGYRWDEDDEDFVLMPPRDLGMIGPAGSVYADVLDMADWARTLMADGVAPNAERVLAPGVLDTIGTEHIAMTDASAYGLGLFIQDWNGQWVLQHGGNIDGYFSTFALMPERESAVILLANTSGSPLQESAIGAAWEALFPDLSVPAPPAEAEPGEDTDQTALNLDAVSGRYALGGTPLTIEVRRPAADPETGIAPQHQLEVALPGQPVYPLTTPTAPAEPWTHTAGVAFALTFLEFEAEIVAIRFSQGPTTMLVPRVGREDAFTAMQTQLAQMNAPFTPEELGRFEGAYRFELQGVDFSVTQQNGRLAVTIPGQMAFELEWPDDEGWWVFRAVPGARVRFHDGDDASEPPASMELSQGPGQFTLPRVEQDTGGGLPSLSDLQRRVREAHRADGWSGDAPIARLTGTISMPNQGISGVVETVFDGPGRLATHTVMAPFSTDSAIVDNDGAWMHGNLTGSIEVTGEDADAVLATHPGFWARDWETAFTEAGVQPSREIRDVTCHVVGLTTPNGAEIVLYIDEDTALVRAVDTIQNNPLLGPVTTRVHLADYREVGPLLLPHEWSGEMIGNGAYRVTYERAEILDARPADAFERRVR